MTAPADLRRLPSADGDLTYLDTGSGDPVVLLHCGFTDHRYWADQIPALAAEHRVIVPDVRGHGWSANATRPFRWADDLAGLLRRLGTGPAVLVGVSMGGVIATDTLLDHPDLVRAAVVSGSATGDWQYTDDWHRGIQAEYARTLAAGDIEGWLNAFLRVLPGEHRTADAVDPDIARRLREMALHTLSKHAPGEKDWLVHSTGSWSRVSNVRVPVLTVNGTLEPADLLAAAERLAAATPGGRSVTIDGVGHYPNLEKPQEYNRILLDFLKSL
ncbi:alpha/beta hydrolase [Streptomyces sp. NPDC052687]|uniref:alpha/beta fold hydrolase n=1 Tax=Streptomyces sp. NPDC052687 TaxID=3154759 RepID=UPI00342DFABF